LSRVLLTAALAALGVAASPPARAGDAGRLRLAIEAGAGAIKPPVEQRYWGGGGGLLVGLALSRQGWVQVHVARAAIRAREPRLDATLATASLVWGLDILAVNPYIGLGISITDVSTADWGTLRYVTPSMELGVDVSAFDWLLYGIAVRYYPLFESDLLGSPAFATVNARIGVTIAPAD
jgi:hypothetical protein